jgi:uncharacterized membrane protein
VNSWHPRSWLAILMGCIVLVFVLITGLLRFFGMGVSDPGVMADMIASWKELMLAIIGGLMVWLGGRADDHKP